MTHICIFCNKTYNNKFTLERHLSTSACKPIEFKNNLELYNFINKQAALQKINNNYKDCIINNNNINIKIEIQPISELSLKNEDDLYNMIEKYFDIQEIKNDISYKNVKDVKFLLSDYLKSQLCNTNNPEKQSIKYVKKYPPTYHISEKRIEGEIVTSIRGFKDSVDLLSDPVLSALKKALFSFEKTLQKNQNDENYKYDYSLYDITIKALKNELNKRNVQSALKQLLKHDILNDINMKMTINENTLV